MSMPVHFTDDARVVAQQALIEELQCKLAFTEGRLLALQAERDHLREQRDRWRDLATKWTNRALAQAALAVTATEEGRHAHN